MRDLTSRVSNRLELNEDQLLLRSGEMSLHDMIDTYETLVDNGEKAVENLNAHS